MSITKISNTCLVTTEVSAPEDDWRQRAACRGHDDPDMWFPVGHGPFAEAQAWEAKRICNQCPVRQRCLMWALDTKQDAGVWGGLSERERQKWHGRKLDVDRGHGKRSAVQRILDDHLAEYRALVAKHLTTGEIARALRTNPQVIHEVRARLEQLAKQQRLGVAA